MLIQGILHKLVNRTADREEINYLINLSHRISRTYLARNYKRISRIYRYFNLNNGEAALDAVAGLFGEDKKGELRIVNSFRTWKPPVKTEPEAIYFLNKVVASAVEQYISSMLRESDPVFSSIYNSLNYLIKSRGYKKILFAGTRYIVKIDKEGFSKDLVPHEVFEMIPAKYFLDRKNLLDGLFSYLEKETNYDTAIPLIPLAAHLKKIYMQNPVIESADLTGDYMKVENAINSAMDKVTALLHEKYYRKNKLTQQEMDFFISALKDICYDMRDGGINPGILKYLSKYMPELNEEEMSSKYYNILEYLLKLLKNNIVEHIEKER